MSLWNSLLLLPLLLLVKFFFPSGHIPAHPLVSALSPSPRPLVATNEKQTVKDIKANLASEDVARLVNTSADDHRLFNETLSKIMVPRAVDTPGHANVRQFIADYLRNLQWTVEQDQFKDKTPHGQKTFTNIIGTLNPRACKRVVLSCHYDSKIFPNFDFVAATDSAVPCAMILELIRILDDKLKSNKNSDLTLQVIFFDGEEAFIDWTKTDSLYGSRHLAAKMDRQNFLRSSSNECSGHPQGRSIKSELDRMDLLILLDLIGEASPQFCNHFSSTNAQFQQLSKIEKKLNKLNLLESKRSSGTNYFPSFCRGFWGGVEDDHVPFMENGVPVLHLITTPFPANWHQEGDNGSNLHHPTINNLMKIFRVFLIEYLKLST